MKTLELKVPPPIVAVLVALAMWAAGGLGAPFPVVLPLRLSVALLIALAGAACSVAGARAFRRARTTVNPMTPGATSALVNNGIYRITRNPMYLGLLCVLVGWTVFLASPYALPGPIVFVLYINRFQIAPEERVLLALFGAEYARYRARVRRWL